MVLKKILTYKTLMFQKTWEHFLQTRNNSYYVFMFHDVVKSIRDMYEQEYCITLEAFAQFCEEMKKNIDKSEWFPIITFDDGFQGIFKNAYPILNELNLQFTVFVTCDFIDQEGYLSTEQLKELSRNNLCVIGSHTKSHARLCELPKEELYDEIKQSRVILESIIETPVECFAYPYGDLLSVKKREIKCVRDAGYKYAFGTLCAGFDKKFLGNYYIPRINVNEENWHRIIKDSLEGRL